MQVSLGQSTFIFKLCIVNINVMNCMLEYACFSSRFSSSGIKCTTVCCHVLSSVLYIYIYIYLIYASAFTLFAFAS